MCTGRLDLAFVLRAFARGVDGVFIAGCHLNECNYITHGNFYALSMTHLAKKLLEHAGIDPARLEMALISGGEGNRFAELMNDFSKTVRQAGPLGLHGGDEGEGLKAKLNELIQLVPYVKMAKKDKLATRFQTEEEYAELYTGEEIDQLLEGVVSYYIDPAKCQACMTCAKRCPVDCIDGGRNLIHVIDQDKCIKCGTCFEACPPRFGAVAKITEGEVPAPPPELQRQIVRRSKAGAA